MRIDVCGSLLVSALESTLSSVRLFHPEVPEAVVNIEVQTPRRVRAMFSRSCWLVSGAEAPAITIARTTLELGAESILSSLLHEAAHGLASARGLKDTSRQGRYHNNFFRDCALELGLHVSQGTHGWNQTTCGKKIGV